MAIVEMRKLTLIGLLDQKDKILRQLERTRCVEIVTSPALAMTENVNAEDAREQLNSGMARCASAINLYKELATEAKRISSYTKGEVGKVEKATKKNPEMLPNDRLALLSFAESENMSEVALYAPQPIDKYAPPDMLTFDGLEQAYASREEAERTMSELEDGMRRINEAKAQRAKIAGLRAQLLPYRGVDIPMNSFGSTKHVRYAIGTVKNLSKVATGINDIPLAEIIYPAANDIDEGSGERVTVIAFHKSAETEVTDLLNAHGYAKCSFEYDCTAEAKIAELDNETKALAAEMKSLAYELSDMQERMLAVRRLYDYYYLELRKNSAAELCLATSRAIIISAWVPTDRAEEIQTRLAAENAVVALEFREPTENEIPPTLLLNKPTVTNFEGITNMFGVPRYGEIDPNGFVAFFYSFLFGVMMGDAGYGIIMTAGCLYMLWKSRHTRKPMYLVRAFVYCGISTILWGILFGSWFAIGNIGGLAKVAIINPMNEPLKMFFLALGLGAIQLMAGYLINCVAEIRAGRVLSGIMGNVGWAGILLGLMLNAPKILLYFSAIEESLPWYAPMGKIGVYIALVCLASVALSGAVGKKNPIKMLTGMFGKLYGGINVMSDLFSYARLFGLGLTSCVIGFVINLLGELIVEMIFGGLWIGWIAAAPILIVGHLFNLALGVLGAYVHDSRLQYIEFFSKFYDGSGHLFRPLGEGQKYTYITGDK